MKDTVEIVNGEVKEVPKRADSPANNEVNIDFDFGAGFELVDITNEIPAEVRRDDMEYLWADPNLVEVHKKRKKFEVVETRKGAVKMGNLILMQRPKKVAEAYYKTFENLTNKRLISYSEDYKKAKESIGEGLKITK